MAIYSKLKANKTEDMKEYLETGGWLRPNNWLKVHGYPMRRKANGISKRKIFKSNQSIAFGPIEILNETTGKFEKIVLTEKDIIETREGKQSVLFLAPHVISKMNSNSDIKEPEGTVTVTNTVIKELKGTVTVTYIDENGNEVEEG